MTGMKRTAKRTIHALKARAEHVAGGPARLQVVLLLGSVLGLDAADKAAVSAIAGSLKQAFQIGNTDIGLLVAAVSFVGAIFTIPLGALVDRMNRKRILLVAIAVWTVAMVISGTATSFVHMLVTRIFLGAVTAAAAPSVASLVGDFFPAKARARAYGMVLGGELIGIGVGFFIAGEVSTILDWRWSLYLMGVPSALIGFALWRYLPEPARGGQSWIRLGQEEVDSNRDSGRHQAQNHEAGQTRSGESARAHERVRESGAQPRQELILHENPTDWGLWRSFVYVLRIPTYRLIVMASALGYYFFAGARAFGMIYITGHYGLSRGVTSALVIIIGLGALVGLWLGARLSGWMLDRGWASARVLVPGGALFLMVLFTAPAIWTTNPVLGIGLLTLGTASLAAANPPMDAARLDVVHPRLWGRAEAGRMAVRGGLEGFAPLVFGWMSTWLASGDTGLELTFLIMLVPVLAASALAIPARLAYPRDVVTADASAKAVPAG
jgi:predicted MFS family arabinose efflux permease